MGLQITPVMFYMDRQLNTVRSPRRGIDREARARRIKADPAREQALVAGRKRLSRVVQALNPDSNLLSSLRLRAGLSQSELAQLLGMQQPNVARLERRPGDLGLSMLRKLSTAFQASLDEVIAAVDYTNQVEHEQP